jgi:hypothetical protein
VFKTVVPDSSPLKEGDKIDVVYAYVVGCANDKQQATLFLRIVPRGGTYKDGLAFFKRHFALGDPNIPQCGTVCGIAYGKALR